MAYEEVTSPIMLDSTGQQIHSDLQQIKSVLTTPSAAADITFDNTGTGMQADDVQDAITELKSNLTDLATIDMAESSGVVAVNGTYQIPAEVLAHTFIIIGARRQGWGNSVMFLTANLVATDNGFFLPTQSNQGYSLKCSSTGLLTLTAKTSGVNDPFIFVQGVF